MESEQNHVTLVKLTKAEKKQQDEEIKRTKLKKKEMIPEKDRIRKKQYQMIIIKTLILFVLAIGVLALMVGDVISNNIGIVCLLIIAIISTVITRGNK